MYSRWRPVPRRCERKGKQRSCNASTGLTNLLVLDGIGGYYLIQFRSLVKVLAMQVELLLFYSSYSSNFCLEQDLK